MSSVEPRGSKEVSKTSLKQATRPATKPNDDREEKRRKSKTPKMHNLSSAGGAFRFETEFVERQISRDAPNRNAPKKSSKYKPDPSPIKKPDPSSKMLSATSRRDSFIASSVGRSSKPNRRAPAKSSERDASSDMDVDTECPTPEKSSATSPYDKPDPEAATVDGKSCRDESKGVSRMATKSSNEVGVKELAASNAQPLKKPVVESAATKIHVPNKTLAAPTAATKTRAAESHIQHEVLNEALDRARDGPIDNKHVLDAMLNSSGRKEPNRNDASQTEASGPSLVGSVVGGASLQRSTSVDGSEVTIPSMSYASKISRSRQSVGAASIFRKPGTIFSGQNTHLSSNIATSINDLSSTHFIRRPTADEREMLSLQIGSQLQSGYTYPAQIHLPAGWQVRISKSKGKPYYVHPDFGSTWHYPGLIIGPHVAVQNVCMDQSLDVSRFTSQASAFQRSNDAASHAMRSAATLDSSRGGVNSSVGGDTMTIDKHSDDAVVLDHSSNASQSKCLTQDSFVNSNTENAAASATKETKEDYSEVHSLAASKQSRNSDIVKFDNSEMVRAMESQCLNSDNNDVDFGAEHDNFGSFEEEEHLAAKDEVVSTVGEEQDDSTSLDLVDEDDLDESKGELLSIDDRRDCVNSLASDHVDVDALLRHSARERFSSPLATIKERMRESSGKQSSQVSLDGDSVNENHVKVESSQKSTNLQGSLFDESSRISDDADKSAIEKAHSQSFEDDGDTFDNDGFSDEEDNENPDFGNNDALIDEYESLGTEMESSAKQSKKKRKLAPLKKVERRKTFPPGPLCSLQMLDLIEDGSLNTPLWRNGKRKRCTLTSLKRARAGKSRKSH